MIDGMKGPKIMNSHSFNHIKNEDGKPKQEEEQNMQTTQKRGQPKINAGKLPSAFTNKRQNKMEPLQKKAQNQKVRNLDNIEAIQEYKQVSQMLSPLKRESNQSKNPLAPLRHFMKHQQKIHDELGLSVSTLVQGQIKMEEMITTGTIRSYADQSPVKKMLHAPTLKMYIVKEEPLQNKEIRKNLKEWISFWQNKFGNSGLHIQVYSSFWNTPEGYVSLVMEYMNGGSLQSLFESIGFLPERAIKQIIPSILSSLNKIHNAGGQCLGALSPSQILFNRDGQIKLNLGLSFRVQSQTNQLFNSYLLGKPKDQQSLYDPTILETPSLWSKASSDKIHFPVHDDFSLEKANDIWKLGFIVLQCAVGTLEFHPKAQQLYEGFRIILEEIHKYQDYVKDSCCVIHSEIKIITLVEQNWKPSLEQNRISIIDMLNSFSQDFISFLCSTLKIDPRQRMTAEQLSQHPFITNIKEYKGPNVTLKELLGISNTWNSSLPEEYQGQGEKKLDRLCDALQLVLSNYNEKPQVTKVQLYESSPLIRELSYDMALNPKQVSERLLTLFQIKNQCLLLYTHNELQQFQLIQDQKKIMVEWFTVSDFFLRYKLKKKNQKQMKASETQFRPIPSKYFLADMDTQLDICVEGYFIRIRKRLIGFLLSTSLFLILLIMSATIENNQIITNIPGNFTMRETWEPPISISIEPQNQLILEYDIHLNEIPIDHLQIDFALITNMTYNIHSNMDQNMTGVLQPQLYLIPQSYLIIQIAMLIISILFLVIEIIKYKKLH
ncbi:hypothetical protein pb186bvf_005485 [Paramecium bursaria]